MLCCPSESDELTSYFEFRTLADLSTEGRRVFGSNSADSQSSIRTFRIFLFISSHKPKRMDDSSTTSSLEVRKKSCHLSLERKDACFRGSRRTWLDWRTGWFDPSWKAVEKSLLDEPLLLPLIVLGFTWRGRPAFLVSANKWNLLVLGGFACSTWRINRSLAWGL